MRFHNERDKRLHPTRHSQIEAPLSGNEKFAIRRPGALGQRPFKKTRCSAVPSQGDGTADDSIMITVCYEAHLSMQQMLAAFAEMRGDDAESPTG
jgi:hypothetical protein